MTLPKTVDELIEITVELCVRNDYRKDVYIRPFAYKAAEDVGVRLHNVPDAFAIVPIPFTHYLESGARTRCLRELAGGVPTIRWRRRRAKITGLYVNSALAKSEAVLNGYDEAILLSHDGHVSEGSAENIFLGAPRRALHPRSLAERARGRHASRYHGDRTQRAGDGGRRALDRPRRACMPPTRSSLPVRPWASATSARSIAASLVTASRDRLHNGWAVSTNESLPGASRATRIG